MKEKPSKQEVDAAIELQAPIKVRTERGEDAPVQRSNTFQQLAKVSRNSNLMFGGAAQWIQPKDLFNIDYKQGDESVPFYITRAWRYTSKQGFGQRLGIEIALSNGRMYQVGLGLNDNDSVRTGIIGAFEKPGSPPIGPFMFVMLPTNKGNDYYDLRPIVTQSVTDTPEIPFVEINDKDIPF